MKTTVIEKSKTGLAKVKRFLAPLAIAATVATTSVVPVFASDGGTTAEQAVITGMTSAAGSMTSMVTSAVPIIIPVITAVVVVTFGFKLFKKLTGKA